MSAVVAVDSSHMTDHLLSGIVSVCLQILLVGTCRLCGSWSVAGHNHRKLIGQDLICADLHDMGCPEEVEQRPCVTREIETWLLHSGVSYNRVVDQTTEADDQSSLHYVVVSTGAMSDHNGRRYASCEGGY